jgi:hypothetical protein
MMLLKVCGAVRRGGNKILPLLGVLALAGCAATDDARNSHLTQPSAPDPQGGIDAGDIAIAGQYFAHAVDDLPQIASAPKPPLVEFKGVTSIVGPQPIDTTPYTNLLRDRLLLITREKLRYVERQLPQLGSASKAKHHKLEAGDVQAPSSADYEVVAELRGQTNDDLYHIQIQLLDNHTGQVAYNALYRIRKEDQPPPEAAPPVENPIEPTNPNPPGAVPAYPPMGTPAQPVDPGASNGVQ